MKRSEEALFHLLEKGTSAVMVVREAQAQLQAAGFEELAYGQSWKLYEGGEILCHFS